MPIDPTDPAYTAPEPASMSQPAPANGPATDPHFGRRSYDDCAIDPAVVLLVEEVRRGNDALRDAMVASQRETTAALTNVTVEIRELRKQAPGRLSFYLAASVVLLALISTFALVATRGVDPGKVADAVTDIAPSAPVNGPTSPSAPQPGP